MHIIEHGFLIFCKSVFGIVKTTYSKNNIPFER